jgi:hypothetical protein
MIDAAKNPNIDAVTLLIHYSFDLGSYSASELTDCWTHDYSANWVRFAVIEALYQGRYKAISVEQILAFWQRRGVASYHFNHEFERLVCNNLSQTLAATDTPSLETASEQNKPISSKGNDGAVKASDTGEKITGIVDATVNIPPAKNAFAKELSQSSNQTSKNEQKSRKHSPPAPPNNGSPKIEHFTPQTDDSGDFYIKLKVLAQCPEAEGQN